MLEVKITQIQIKKDLLNLEGKIINQYHIGQNIGCGASGKVYKSTKNNKDYALKLICFKNSKQKQKNKQSLNVEIKALSLIRHQNVVKLYQVFQTTDKVFLVMELCQYDLKTMLQLYALKNDKKGGLPEKQAYKIMTQIIKGLRQINSRGFVHRDIKPSNILYLKGTYKVADFGVAKQSNKQNGLFTSMVGTLPYMSPQLLTGKSYTNKCDVWAIGCLFYELLFGQRLWKYSDLNKNYVDIQRIKTRFQQIKRFSSSPISAKTIKLLQGMLELEDHNRFSLEKVYQELSGEEDDKFQVHLSEVQKLFKIMIDQISLDNFGLQYSNISQKQKNKAVDKLKQRLDGILSKFIFTM